jgi:hypothetical protein
MGHFCVSKIIHYNNDSEFCGVLEENFCKVWIEIAHGRAQHMQWQGSIEQGKRVIKRKLATW